MWCQEEVTRDAFYWLSVPHEYAKRGMTVIANRKGNVIELEQCDYPEISIYLNSNMVNLLKKVTVKYKGRKVFKGRLKPSADTARKTLFQRGDTSYMFDAVINVNL